MKERESLRLLLTFELEYRLAKEPVSWDTCVRA